MGVLCIKFGLLAVDHFSCVRLFHNATAGVVSHAQACRRVELLLLLFLHRGINFMKLFFLFFELLFRPAFIYILWNTI